MKIGDTIICKDNFESESLEFNKEYVIVDINQHGNLGVKDISRGCLLNHYYKPDRFAPKPVAPQIKCGQVYQYKKGYSCGHKEKFMVVNFSDNNVYCLINLTNGQQHYPIMFCIDDVFGGNNSMFELVNNPFA